MSEQGLDFSRLPERFQRKIAALEAKLNEDFRGMVLDDNLIANVRTVMEMQAPVDGYHWVAARGAGDRLVISLERRA